MGCNNYRICPFSRPWWLWDSAHKRWRRAGRREEGKEATLLDLALDLALDLCVLQGKLVNIFRHFWLPQLGIWGRSVLLPSNG